MAKCAMILNEWGVALGFDVAVGYMVNEIRERLHRDMAPCAPQSFFDAYCAAHAEKFGEEWVFAKKNPIY